MNHFYKIYSLLDNKEKKSLVVLLFLMIFVALLEMASIGLILPLLDLFTSSSNENYIEVFINRFFVIESSNALIVFALFFYMFVFLIKNLMSLFLYWAQARFSNLMKARISRRLMTYYLRKPFEFHINKNSAELVRNAFSEVGTVVGAGVQPMIQILAESFVVIGMLLVLFKLEPTGSLLIMAVASIGLYIVFHFLKTHLYRWGKSREFHDGKRIQYIQQGISSIRDIKIFGGEDEFIKQYHFHNLHSVFATIKQSTIQQLPRLLIESLMVSLVVIYVATMILYGSTIEDLAPVIAVFALASFRLLPSANRIVTSLQSIRYGMPVVETIYKDLDDFKNNYLITKVNLNKKSKSLIFNENIRIKDLSYSYSSNKKKIVLSDINLEIEKGDRIAIVGKSGAGKSTLLNIMLGLLDQISGSIKVDGIDIKSNMNSWRSKLSVVPQEIFLTDNTIAKNIAFGVSNYNVDNNLIWDAVEKSQLKSMIDDLPEKLETIVGERGIRFSAGERQRIGLARALYHKPEILVLDEATSSLDVKTEKNIMKSIYSLSPDLTIIIVTHRESTIYGCNKIFEIKNRVISDKNKD